MIGIKAPSRFQAPSAVLSQVLVRAGHHPGDRMLCVHIDLRLGQRHILPSPDRPRALRVANHGKGRDQVRFPLIHHPVDVLFIVMIIRNRNQPAEILHRTDLTEVVRLSVFRVLILLQDTQQQLFIPHPRVQGVPVHGANIQIPFFDHQPDDHLCQKVPPVHTIPLIHFIPTIRPEC